MANTCINTVIFTGNDERLKSLESLFTDMAAEGRRLDRGMLPYFIHIHAQGGYFFNISWENDVLYYETKWSPNIEIIATIASYFKVSSIHQYDECGCLIYGEAKFHDGILVNISLDDEDFNRMDYDEVKEVYLFDGREFECVDEVLELLLDEKKGKVGYEKMDWK